MARAVSLIRRQQGIVPVVPNKSETPNQKRWREFKTKPKQRLKHYRYSNHVHGK